jgi:DNA-binding NtrC family response regulator
MFSPSTAHRSKDRLEDIPIIVRNFIRVNNEKSGKKILGMTPEAIESITTYAWPGNVRELRNAIEYAFVLCPSGGIGVDHLPPKIVMDTQRLRSTSLNSASRNGGPCNRATEDSGQNHRKNNTCPGIEAF